MKTYTITVNGNVYDVTVEEGTGKRQHPAAAPECSSEGSTCKAAPKAAAPAASRRFCKSNSFCSRVKYLK